MTAGAFEGFASGALGLLLGAVAPTTDVALALFPPVLVLMIIFNGFNLAEENTPKCLRFLPKVSFIKWTSEALAVHRDQSLRSISATLTYDGGHFSTGERVSRTRVRLQGSARTLLHHR